MHPTENKLSVPKLDSDPVFEHIQQYIRAQPEKAKSFSAVILFQITKNGQTAKKWTLDLAAAKLYVGEPKNNKPANTIISISDEDFVLIMLTKLNPQQAFMEGKIKMSGNSIWIHKVWILLRTTANAKL